MIVSSVVVLEAVVGRREWRDSWRRFCTPWSLLKDELDFDTLLLLLKLLLAVEKLLADGSRRLNMVAGVSMAASSSLAAVGRYC